MYKKLIAFLAPVFLLTSGAAAQPSDLTGEEEAVQERARAWIEEGFSPKDNAERYTYDEYLNGFYARDDGGLSFHDNNDPEMRIETNARRYGRIWEQAFANVDYVDNEVTRWYQIEVDGDLGFVSFTADALVRPVAEAEIIRMPVFYSLVWRKDADGVWRMIHEHGSILTPNSAVTDAQGTPDAAAQVQVRARVEEWFAGWSPGEGLFDAEAMRDLFAEGEILVRDDFGGEIVTLRSFDEYARIWQPVMRESFSYYRIEPVGAIDISVDGDLAVTAFEWRADARDKSGAQVEIGQVATLVWRLIEGDWRIVQEQLTSR